MKDLQDNVSVRPASHRVAERKLFIFFFNLLDPTRKGMRNNEKWALLPSLKKAAK